MIPPASFDQGNTIQFKEIRAFDSVNLSLMSGEFVVIAGPSAAGTGTTRSDATEECEG